MIVHCPEVQVREGVLRVRVRIEYEKPAAGMPQVLWVDMPPHLQQHLSPRMDGWAAALFLVAMRRGEAFTVRGTLSEQLAHNLEEYQRAVSQLEPREVKYAPLRAERYERPNEPAPKGVGMTFSGGVDSFFTLWSNIEPCARSLAYHLTHGIFVEGVDIGYGDQAAMRACRETYSALFESLELEYWTLRTNIRDLYPEAEWGGWMCFPFLSGVGLLFGKAFGKFYVAAGGTYWDWSHGNKRFLLNHLFSTETLQLLHDGLTWSRVAKVAQIAHWEPVQQSLRVCYTAPDKLINCCRCPKCLHTMVCLDLAGELQNTKTFPLGYTRRQLRATTYPLIVLPIVNDTREYARRVGRHDIAADLAQVMAVSALRSGFGILRRRVTKRIQKR